MHRRSRASRRSEESSLLSSEVESIPARHLRIQSTLFQEVSRLFRGELSDPLLEGVSVTSLELTPDGRNARIGFTLPPELAPHGLPGSRRRHRRAPPASRPGFRRGHPARPAHGHARGSRLPRRHGAGVPLRPYQPGHAHRARGGGARRGARAVAGPGLAGGRASQPRRRRAPLRPRAARPSQGRRGAGRRTARPHPREHGDGLLSRRRQGTPPGLLLVLARGGPRHEPQGGPGPHPPGGAGARHAPGGVRRGARPRSSRRPPPPTGTSPRCWRMRRSSSRRCSASPPSPCSRAEPGRERRAGRGPIRALPAPGGGPGVLQ